MAFTKLTASVAIITALANQIRGQASYVKGKFDEAPGIIKTFLNDTFIAELESTTNGSSGADNVGCTTVLTGGGTTVQSNLEAVYAEVVVVAGTGIPNDSVTEAKMVAAMKKGAGGVAPYDTTVFDSDVGNTTGKVPISNGTVCTNLNAEMLGGKQTSDFVYSAKVYGNVSYTDSIAGGATLTKSIALGASGYREGKVIIHNTSNVTHGVCVFFTTDSTKTIVTGVTNNGGYVGGSAWSRTGLGRITNAIIGYNATGFYNIWVDEVYIDGSDLKVVFRNNDVSSNNLVCTLAWEVQ